MRHTYLVAYDICDPKRLRQVFKTMKGWGDHLQLSVFRCDLSQRELIELRTELSSLINHAEDQVLFADIGPADGRALNSFDAIGLPLPAVLRVALVV
jgi:CRISPR-associated protein Cas2